MRDAILNRGLQTLGVCLGMQLPFNESEEGSASGLGVIPGHVTRLQARRVPQIGWNTLEDMLHPDRSSAARVHFIRAFIHEAASKVGG